MSFQICSPILLLVRFISFIELKLVVFFIGKYVNTVHLKVQLYLVINSPSLFLLPNLYKHPTRLSLTNCASVNLFSPSPFSLTESERLLIFSKGEDDTRIYRQLL